MRLESTPFKFVPPEISHKDFQEMRDTSNSTTNRERVANMAQRGATAVLGEPLVTAAAQVIQSRRVNSYEKDSEWAMNHGIQVIQKKYSPSITAVAASLGWNEKTSDLQILCARLYHHEVGLRLKTERDSSQMQKLSQLQSSMDTEIANYTEKNVPSVNIIHLTKYLTMPNYARRGLKKQLDTGRTDVFFETLKELAEK